MANTFPAAIANEPPPCESSEDEDSEEFRSHGLKLDVPSGDPTPVSTPLKKRTKSPSTLLNRTINNTNNCDDDSVSGKNYKNVQVGSDADRNYLKENGTRSPDSVNNDPRLVNGTEDFTPTVVVTNNISDNLNEELSESQEESENIGELTDGTSASEDIDAANNEICDTTANHVFEQNLEETSDVEFVDSSSPFDEMRQECFEEGPSDIHAEATEENPGIGVSNCFENDHLESSCGDGGGDSSSKSSLNESEQSVDNVDHKEAKVDNQVDVGDDEDDEFGDFGGFQSVPSSSTTAEASIDRKEAVSSNTGVQQSVDGCDDDDFGDFAQFPVQPQAYSEAPVPSTSIPSSVSAQKPTSFEDDNDDDFADFQDCSFQSSVPVPTASVTTAPLPLSRSNSITSDISLIPAKVESIVKCLFPSDSSSLPDSSSNPEDAKLKSIDSEISISKDEVWNRIQNFEDSQGLAFKWLNSLTETRLLRSLNIDNSNIMYHEKWGTIEVPKFAASLVMSPLQPVSCSSNPNASHSKRDPHNNVTLNNNIIDGISCQNQDKPSSISAEAQEILRQLPDLSYMRATTLVFPQTSPSGI